MPRKSTGNYPSNWSELARQVKEDANWHCTRCGHPHDPSVGYCLTVHHLDLNRANSSWWNLVGLCQRCHLHIQAKVFLNRVWFFEHSDWFKPYVAGYYGHVVDQHPTREQVIANPDVYLAMGQPWLYGEHEA